jgi:galactokinase
VIRATAPGRVNLMGDHVDYVGGLVLPMAIQLGTTIVLSPGGDVVELASASEPERARVPITGEVPVAPRWATYVAGVIAELRPTVGGTGTVTTTLPIGAGLSSSAALMVAVALALGFDGSPLELARLCRRGEQAASGVPVGIMDQLASAAGVDGHALLIDCATETYRAVPIAPGLQVSAVHSGEARTLATSGYARRRQEATAVEDLLGSTRRAAVHDAAAISDPVLRRRARHIVSENARTLQFVDALGAGDRPAIGALMAESHASLRDDYEVSTTGVDALVDRLARTPGVIGARLTGGGFGGAVVVIAEVGADIGGQRLHASAGATRTDDEGGPEDEASRQRR